LHPSVFLVEDISTIQLQLLSYVGQQAIAHAAAIFAMLTAAFTFASGFKEKAKSSAGAYVGILTALLTGGFYAGIRLYYYGVISTVILNRPAMNFGPDLTLSSYWSYVAAEASRNSWLTGTVQSLTLSWMLGSVLAVAVFSRLIIGRKFLRTFGELPMSLGLLFRLALADYVLEWALVPSFVTAFRSNLLAVVLALGISLAAATASLTFHLPSSVKASLDKLE
jgi:hypothetical protein